MKKPRKGKIDISELNVPPEKHEYETARYFADRGFNITFIKPGDIKGQNSPDFEMAKRIWETKSPIKFSNSSFEDNYKKAVRQSEYVIFDLRRLKIRDEKKYLARLNRKEKSRKVRILLVITRDGRLLTIKGLFDILKV